MVHIHAEDGGTHIHLNYRDGLFIALSQIHTRHYDERVPKISRWVINFIVLFQINACANSREGLLIMF